LTVSNLSQLYGGYKFSGYGLDFDCQPSTPYQARMLHTCAVACIADVNLVDCVYVVEKPNARPSLSVNFLDLGPNNTLVALPPTCTCPLVFGTYDAVCSRRRFMALCSFAAFYNSAYITAHRLHGTAAFSTENVKLRPPGIPQLRKIWLQSVYWGLPFCDFSYLLSRFPVFAFLFRAMQHSAVLRRQVACLFVTLMICGLTVT